MPATQAIFDTVNFKAPFDAGGDVPQNTYRLVGRLDFNLSEKTQMFFRAGRESVEDFLGTPSTPLIRSIRLALEFLTRAICIR